MAASPLTLFSSVLQAKPNASASDNTAASVRTGVDFAALISASGNDSENTASAMLRANGSAHAAFRGRVGSDAAFSATQRQQERVITPREARRALDRLDQAVSQRQTARDNATDCNQDAGQQQDANARAAASASAQVDANAKNANAKLDASAAATDRASDADAASARASAKVSARTDATAANASDEADADLALRQQLQAIIDSDTPAPLTTVLAQLPPEDAEASLLFLQRFAVTAEVEPQGSFQGIRAMIQKLHQALQFSADATGTEAQLGTLPAADASVQLSTLLTPATESASEAEIAATTAEETGTVVTITPLAQSAVILPAVAPQVQAAAEVNTKAATNAVTDVLSAARKAVDVSASVKAIAAPSEAVASAELTTKAVNIEMLVPSLALTADEKQAALPEIELPKSSVSAAASAKVETPVAPAPVQTLSKIEQQLQAFTLATQASAQEAAANVDGAKVTATAGGVAAVNGITNAHATGAAHLGAAVGAPAGASAVTTIASLVNNAPIREQVHVAITKAKEEGLDQITIQLDPLGLGRVEVKMHTDKDGHTAIAFMVDKPETFDALSRDARGLERSLQESGLKTDSGGMQFNLRQQTQSHADMGGGNSSQGNRGQAQVEASAQVSASASAAPQTTTRHYSLGVQEGIDIQA